MPFLDRFRPAARSERAFVELALAVARHHPDVERVEVSSDEELSLIVVLRGQNESRVSLSRPWKATKTASRGAQRMAIDQLLTMFATRAAPPSSWEEARGQLFLALRDATWLLNGEEGSRPLVEPVLDGLHLVLYLDLETTMSPVMPEDLERWGVTREEAWEAASANTRRLVPAVRMLEPGSMNRIQGGQIDAASYLLASGWLASLTGGRDAIVWTADRDWVNVWVAGNVDDLSGLARATREEWEGSPSGVSPRLYRFSKGAVRPIETTKDDPAYEELEISRLVLAASQCATQKERLDEQHERDGLDIWVGNLMLFQTDEGVTSIVAWTDDCDSLLPFPDRFSFVREGTEPFELPAAEVVEAAGITPVPGLYPPRFRASRWPDADVLRSLGAPLG